MIIKKTSSEWNLYTEILPLGQIAYETDTYRFKIGNGISPWIGNVLTALPYATVIIETSTLLTSENLRIALNVVVLETDTNKFKIGDGSNFWNVLPYQKIVTASRFNNLQSRINLILGNGASDRGYGQGSGYGLAVSSYQVNSNSNVRANDINSVYADIVRARIHQIGTEPSEIKELFANLNVIAEETSNFVKNDTGIAVPSTDTQGSRKGIADYETLMNTVDLDRFLAHPSQMSLETRLSNVRTALWNGTIFHEFSVQFNNENHRRHFFNSGGNIRISARNTNAVRPKGLDWDQILLNSGTVSFNYTNTTTTGSGTGSNIGNYDLTTSYVPIYQKIGQGTVDILYTGNTYVIYAKEIGNATISFKIELNDVAGAGTTFDANIEGRLATTIQEYRASSNAVEVSPPAFITTTALDTFGEPSPIYQLTTTKTTVKEGEPFTIVLNTFNVPNGSTVPYVISGGVTAADLGLTSLVGNFIINNNAASKMFTPTLDSLQNETTEEFILTLNNDAALIKVNILNETLPTYNLTANKSTVEEGETFSITLNTTKISDGTLLPYTITGIAANDISPASLRGNFVINNNTSSVTFTTINDNLLEGSETFRLELDNLQDSISVLITDAQEITYSLTANKTSVKEGESFIVTLNTTFLANGTQVPYVITGIGVGDITQPGLTGIFTLNNNTASITFNTVLDTQTNEGNETFNLKLVNNAANVSVVIEEVVLPTSATRTCIAVIDEASIGGLNPSSTVLNSSWATFRQNWPNRPFYLLQPNILNSGGQKYTNPSTITLQVPAAYTAETVALNPKAFGPIEVNRDEGVVSRASDWFTICNLGNLPNGSKIALFIDTSGSMNTDTIRASLAIFRQKLAEKNMQVIEVFNSQENWILPFNTILDTSTTSVLTPTYNLNSLAISGFEPTGFTVSVTTTNVPNATVLYLTIDGATTADFSAVQVSTIINNNAGTFPQIQMLADGLTEGDETYTASLRTGSFTGPVVDTLTITVRD